GRGGGLGGVEVRGAEAAAEVEALDGQAFTAELFDEAAHLPKGGFEGGEVGDLAADVAGHRDGADVGVVAGLGVEAGGLGEGDAELVLRLAGGDLGVAAGGDVGV